MAIVHSKVDQIPDWAQEQLNNQIALGNYPPGTTLADIVLPSDWNDGHNIETSTYQIESDAGDAVDTLANGLRRFSIIDMSNDDYTMTLDEAVSRFWIILNGGTGKTLTIPATANYKTSSLMVISTFFVSNPITVASETGAASVVIAAGLTDLVGFTPSSGVSSLGQGLVSDAAYGSSWDGVTSIAPSKNAVYDKLESMTDNAITQNFLLMGG